MYLIKEKDDFMFKIAINAGHGLYTSGKRCLKSIDPNETREWQLNSRIVSKVIERLQNYDGYELLRIDDPTGQRDIPLKERTDKANKWGADFYLAIHHNAGIAGGSGGGIMAFTYLDNKIDQNTRDWQTALYNALIAHTGLKGNRSNPIAHSNLHEVRETRMAAVLIENGFMDSTSDTPIILSEDFANKSADAIVEVLAACGGLKKKDTHPAPIGVLDGASQNGFSGWAYNGEDDTPVEVHVYVSKDGKDVLGIPGVMANIYREDLKNAGIGNGVHGFCYNYDLYAALGEGMYKVRAYAIDRYGRTNPLLNNEHIITVTAPLQPEPTPEPTPEPIEPTPTPTEPSNETPEIVDKIDKPDSDNTNSSTEENSNDNLIVTLVKTIYKAILKLLELLKKEK